MKRFLMIAAASTLLTGVLFAQSAPATQPNDPNTVNARHENQQDRIANGVSSGQLTAGETSNLESREANLNREIKGDRQDNSGKPTGSELQQVNEQQAKLNKSIYADKHNAAQQNYKGEVGARQENQQDRIAQGIRSGQMTAGEAARAEKNQKGINQQIHADRAANGGKLTGSELAQVNREENRTSRQIYREKHNGPSRGQQETTCRPFSWANQGSVGAPGSAQIHRVEPRLPRSKMKPSLHSLLPFPFSFSPLPTSTHYNSS